MPTPKKSPVAKKLQWAGIKPPHEQRQSPLWKGPQEDGITFSLLSRFLCCRERFRLLVVEGLAAQDHFNHRLEFGSLWHVCEEALATGVPWQKGLLTYARALAKRYPTDQEQVDKWYTICLRQFPIYLEYWNHHHDVVSRQNLMAEVAFKVPYRLPSGRGVLLRGKWDSVDLIGDGKHGGVYLQENKTKGEVNEQQIKRQLTFDLQTMLYLAALHEPCPGSIHATTSAPILGIRYNVIRRPLSGGKGSIVQGKGTAGTKCTKCKGTGRWESRDREVQNACAKCNGAGRTGGTPPETKEEYYDRLAKYIKDEPDTYFFRWKVEVSPEDVQRFRRECLDPILEQLCDWWEYVQSTRFLADSLWTGRTANEPNRLHWRHPFGVWNVLDEGGSSDVDEYLASGSEAGLARITNLFPELT